MTAARLFLRRVKWKRPPTHLEEREVLLATAWGPDLYASDRDWFFAGQNGHSDPAPPIGARRISHHNLFSQTREATNG